VKLGLGAALVALLLLVREHDRVPRGYLNV
jgi:hypothetical protein